MHRGWHGTSPHSMKSILSEKRLRPTPRPRGSGLIWFRAAEAPRADASAACLQQMWKSSRGCYGLGLEAAVLVGERYVRLDEGGHDEERQLSARGLVGRRQAGGPSRRSASRSWRCGSTWRRRLSSTSSTRWSRPSSGETRSKDQAERTSSGGHGRNVLQARSQPSVRKLHFRVAPSPARRPGSSQVSAKHRPPANPAGQAPVCPPAARLPVAVVAAFSGAGCLCWRPWLR